MRMVGSFEQLAEAMRETVEAQNNKPHAIDPLAQAIELTSRYKSVKGELTEAVLVKEKRGLGRFTNNPVLVVWRILDHGDYQDAKLIKDYIKRLNGFYSEPLDILVGFLTDDGTTLVFQPHSASMLEPYLESNGAEAVA